MNKDYIFICLHCNNEFIININDFNCKILRHGKVCIEKAKLFLFTTTALKNKTTFYFLKVFIKIIYNK